MRNIKLSIQYDGTRYQGWQRLSDSQNTIQEKIETVLSTLVKEDIQLVGSGRTDAGVHAENQVANFHSRSLVSCGEIVRHCYAYLPHDIVVKTAHSGQNGHRIRLKTATDRSEATLGSHYRLLWPD